MNNPTATHSGGILVAALLALVCCATTAIGQSAVGSELAGMIVSQVEVKGNQFTDRAFVLSRMKTKPGKPYDLDVLDADIKRLYETGYFNDVETRATRSGAPTEGGGVLVTVVVVENQIVSRVLFEGRTRLTRQELAGQIVTTAGNFLDPADLKADATRIEEAYRDKGYYHVVVQAQRRKVADGVEVIFEIAEGPRVSIRDIDIRGADSLDEKILRKIMKTRESLWILSVAYYDEDQVQTDIVNLRRYYRDEGFLDVEVDLAEVNISEDRKKIDLVILVDEGERYSVRNLDVRGMEIFDAERVREVMELQPGGLYRTESLLKDRDGIKQIYGDAGYLFTEVAIDVDYVLGSAQVDITLTVTENQGVRIGLIRIEGNEQTKDKVVRRDLEFFPFERASLSRIQRSINRLMGRDYYPDGQGEADRTGALRRRPDLQPGRRR
jgi:outer membrane protein insertion porin family